MKDKNCTHIAPSCGTSCFRSIARIWSIVWMDGERPPCTQKIFPLMTAERLRQSNTSVQHRQTAKEWAFICRWIQCGIELYLVIRICDSIHHRSLKSHSIKYELWIRNMTINIHKNINVAAIPFSFLPSF